MNTQFPRPPLLSKRQAELCSALERMTTRLGYAPSIRELAVELSIHPSRVAQLMRSTAAKGAIAWQPGTARSWRLVRSDVAPKARRSKS